MCVCVPDLSCRHSPVRCCTAERGCPDPHTVAGLQEGAVGGCTGGVGAGEWREGVEEEVGSHCWDSAMHLHRVCSVKHALPENVPRHC